MPLWQRIQGFTREIGPPAGWDEKTQGPCATVWVRDEVNDGIPFMCFAMEFTPEELALLQEGKPFVIGIAGVQLPLMICNVGDWKA